MASSVVLPADFPPSSWDATVPIPVGQCPACHDDDRHAWIEVDRYRTDTATLRRLVCQCRTCLGRCDGRLVLVDTPYSWRRQHA